VLRRRSSPLAHLRVLSFVSFRLLPSTLPVGIRIGPTLPGFVTPNMLAILQKEFDLKLIGDAKEDLAQALQGN
jgi:hydroxylamine reductase (hybrid-cluster protein)